MEFRLHDIQQAAVLLIQLKIARWLQHVRRSHLAHSYDQPSKVSDSATGDSSGSAAVVQYTLDVIQENTEARRPEYICVNIFIKMCLCAT